MLKNIQIRWLLSLVLLLTAIGTTAQNQPKEKEVKQNVTPLLNNDDTHRFSYFYLEAIRQENMGNYAAAYDLLCHCLDINPNSAETYFNLATYYNELREDSMALACMEKAASLSPSNNTYLERLGHTLIKVDDYERATKVYERLAEVSPTRTDVLGILSQLYQLDHNYDGMLRVIDKIELLEGPSEDIALSRMQIYAKQGKKKEELKVLKEMARQFPNDLNYRVMMGNWLLQNGKKKEALAEYNHVLRKEPDNIMALMSLLDYYKDMGNDKQVKEITERILLSNNSETSDKISLLHQIIMDSEKEGGDSTAVLSIFEKMLDVPKPDADIAEICATYMELKHMPQKEVNAAWERVLSIAPDNDNVRIKLLEAIWEEKDYDRIISQCKPALEYNPENLAFYYFMGLAHYQKGDFDTTLEVFKKGIERIDNNSNSSLASDFYEITGDLLYKKGLDEEAFSAYDKCLNWNPNNIGCLNNYAYYLSEKGERLAEAEQMSYRTVKAEPNNSTYLDTYAWILFMQGRYEEAKIYIEQAVRNNTSQDNVITEHAGDIYIMCNEADKAVEYWQKALEQGSESKELLEKKIKNKKYIAK